MPNMFLNGGTDCCCCDDIFGGPPGVAVDSTHSGTSASLGFRSRSGTNRYKSKFLITVLGVSAVDQINKVFFADKLRPGTSSLVLSSRIIRGDVQANVDDDVNNPHVEIYAKLNDTSRYQVTSLALDKRNSMVYFIERATVIIGGAVTFTLYSMPYSGGVPTALLTLDSSTTQTGYMSWHPGLLSLYCVVHTATDRHIKLLTALGESSIYSVATGTTLFIHNLELDLQRGEMWWVERNLTASDASSVDTVKKSSLSGGFAATLYITTARNHIGILKRSYKHSCMIFSKYRNDVTFAQDAGNGLFIADFNFINLELFFDSSLAINEATGLVEPLRFSAGGELYCGYEDTGPAYQGA